MSEVTSFKQGTLCWTDLQTSDQPAARRFYTALFGWETDDIPMGPASVYTLAKRAGRDVAAVAGLPPDHVKDMTPHWNVYFWVKRVDEAVSHAVALGGKIIRPAFDALDLGRMATLQDPAGAAFSVWEAKKGMGAGRIKEHGAMAWPTLETKQIDRCREFYSKLFGWNAKTHNGSHAPGYTVFTDGSENRADMSQPQGEPATDHWTIDFRVDDIDRTASTVESLGGKVLIGPHDVPGSGRCALLADPQRAVFGVIQARQM